MTTTITERALNRSTLARQLLLEREPLGVEDAVRRVVALQAQQPASPYLALWNRLSGFDAADLDAALAGYRVVKSTLMRITLHAVHADDYRALREAVEPTVRGARLGDPRFRRSGLTAQDADELLPELLARASAGPEGPCTSAELGEWLAERVAGLLSERGGVAGKLEPAAWRMLRQYAPLWHAPVGGPWSFVENRHAFVAAGGGVPVPADAERSAASLKVLVRRYLEGFGPASVADVAQFALVQKGRVRAALAELADEVEQFAGPRGAVLYDVPGGARPDGDAPAPPRLMAMWDSVLLAYADRGRVLPPEYRKHVTRVNGDVLPTLLVDGHVAGVWRMARDGTGVEAAAFRPLAASQWAGLEAEAGALTAFVRDREPRVYGRYDHWWAKGLPVVERRVLAG
ncbi:winged helix DNA-binding domain-containing protein [Streptomyces beihaiensis]|uniref:Winged helix DNA-binding domain-containing protein n=1 Tax=Streptomyces beihaiensis TaxID=2984495 RepID=A0ABT3U756_9ACTN|nr:winged helix DNA-binding domain-containing protein [Streptomyces beihaiensis]MCX3064030.1 winged helix DNA-binding domain-containing protein [Streptomyces beihaiensis]